MYAAGLSSWLNRSTAWRSRTLVHGTVVDPSNLPPAPDEAALLEELELYPVDADELIPVQAEARANAQAKYAEQVQRYAWALVEAMAPALAQDWQLAAPSRTSTHGGGELYLPEPAGARMDYRSHRAGEMA